MDMVTLTSAQLKEAAMLKESIETSQARLAEILSGVAVTTTVTKAKGKRTLSEKARRAIAAGQAKRWAAVRAKEAAASVATTAPAVTPAPVAVAA